MNRVMKKLLVAGALLASAAFVAPVANALTIDIDDRGDSVQMFLNGGLVSQNNEFASVTGAVAGLFDGFSVRFTVLEPGTSSISDIFTLILSPNTLNGSTGFAISFVSDSDIGAPFPFDPPAADVDRNISETGDFQTVYRSSDALGQNPDLVIRFASDVPVPGTVGLVGLGLAGLGFSRRKRTSLISIRNR
jgi:hypothetical protein